MQRFADEALVRLRGLPEDRPGKLSRFFTLMPADPAFVVPGRGMVNFFRAIEVDIDAELAQLGPTD